MAIVIPYVALSPVAIHYAAADALVHVKLDVQQVVLADAVAIVKVDAQALVLVAVKGLVYLLVLRIARVDVLIAVLALVIMDVPVMR